jgi:hypothetical protein
MKMYTFSSIMFVIVCLSSVNLLSLNKGPCKKRDEVTPPARVNEARPLLPAPVVVVEPPKPVGPQRVQQVPLNRIVSIRNLASGLCLACEVRNEGRYHMADCNPSDIKQQFLIRPKNGEWWQIFAVSNNLVIDLAFQGSHEGNYYWNIPINDTAAQNFRMPIYDGYFGIINQTTNKCVSNSSGNIIDQRSCVGGDRKQNFYIQQ